VSAANEERSDNAIYQIVRAAIEAAPDNPAGAVELMLVSAVYYCREALKLSMKDACNFVDVCLVEVFDKSVYTERE
jgi:hypothetical protein